MSFVSHWPTRDAVDLATLLSIRRQCDSLLFDGSIRTTTAPKSRERNPIWQFFFFVFSRRILHPFGKLLQYNGRIVYS